MQRIGTVDINLTIAAWAEIVIDKWHYEITDQNIIDKGNLDNSLMHTLLVNAGQDIERVEFSFKLYGIFVDMGVGGGETRLSANNDREAKEWFSKKYFGQIMKLKQLLTDRYATAIAYSMMDVISNDLSAPPTTKLNLRRVQYSPPTAPRQPKK